MPRGTQKRSRIPTNGSREEAVNVGPSQATRSTKRATRGASRAEVKALVASVAPRVVQLTRTRLRILSPVPPERIPLLAPLGRQNNVINWLFVPLVYGTIRSPANLPLIPRELKKAMITIPRL